MNRVLKHLRFFYQKSQSELAKELELSKSYISEIESGKKDITLRVLNKYSKIFNIPTSKLMYFSEIENNEDLKSKFLSELIKR
ncbi:MAG: helix-turn-helix transcriptional regulator [Candidatus Brocadiales bacterium]|nr:helix-turn-helix transcriptional regulator [Candidatus Brocadiales bacterium]